MIQAAVSIVEWFLIKKLEAIAVPGMSLLYLAVSLLLLGGTGTCSRP